MSKSKRDFLKSAALMGAAAGAAAGLAGAMKPREALAQMLETGIREDSALAKIKKA
jgi:nitrous oxide reductase